MTKIHKTDVLVIGGGLGGCMAAIAARRSGVKVTIVEKSHIDRSGAAGTGNDHFWHYNPEIHPSRGWTVPDMVKDISWSGEYGKLINGFIDQELCEIVARGSFERVLDLESMGIRFRFDEIHPWNLDYPAGLGEKRFKIVPQFQSEWDTLNYEGRDIKVVLGRECRKIGVEIFNRFMVSKLLLKSGRASGVIAVSQRSGEVLAINAKAVVIATGMDLSRLYRAPSGDWFNFQRPPMITGDGEAMALDAGVNLFIRGPARTRNTGLQHFKNLYRSSGVATTSYPAGKIVNADGEVVIDHPAVREPMRKFRENLEADVREGRTPFYLDLTRSSEEEIRYAEWSYGHEGLCWVILEMMRDLGLDFRRDAFELDIEEPGRLLGGRLGLFIDTDCRTNVEGLFAASPIQPAGEVSAPIPVVLGYRAGERAASLSKTLEISPLNDGEIAKESLEIIAPLSRGKGSSWIDVNVELNNIMEDYKRFYSGISLPPIQDAKSIRGLDSLLVRLHNLKNEPMKADDPHELIRCLEVKNLITVAEALVVAAKEPGINKPGFWFLGKKSNGKFEFELKSISYKYPKEGP